MTTQPDENESGAFYYCIFCGEKCITDETPSCCGEAIEFFCESVLSDRTERIQDEEDNFLNYIFDERM